MQWSFTMVFRNTKLRFSKSLSCFSETDGTVHDGKWTRVYDKFIIITITSSRGSDHASLPGLDHQIKLDASLYFLFDDLLLATYFTWSDPLDKLLIWLYMYIHVHVFTINDLVIKAVVFIPTLLDVISLKTFCRWIHGGYNYVVSQIGICCYMYMNTIEELGVTIQTLYMLNYFNVIWNC